MNQTKEELAMMVDYLSMEVARLTTDKAMLMAKLEMVQQQLQQLQQVQQGQQGQE